ncbi:hypothetical protein QFC21_004595 [Naganishia friedmannii]|uniref:Uncharacterized protein n=1 Tax=Naganishia friedmannii TaxID=89922 RepID=A0ACC2VHH3_9TREE|nr:hypothetical protein QFC21_004595 [Naganishia friedmannii]
MSDQAVRFDNQVVLVTGAGAGIGKAYSLFFASRGASVVVNDLSAEACDQVVKEIQQAGGKAAGAVGSVTDGEGIVRRAVEKFGTVHVLINNAGVLRDKSFKKMSDADFDLITAVHLKGAYACTKACWPIFRGQKYGRIINTASAAGLYGNLGQANYAAAKMGLVAFTRTLAKEGVKYNIKANVIAPIAASSMTATIMPPEMLKHLTPDFVAPVVGVLCSSKGPDVTGRLFELGAGFVSEIRWQRAKGAYFKPDETFTPSAVKAKWDQVMDFSQGSEYPVGMEGKDPFALLKESQTVKSNPQSDAEVNFRGKTVIITGAGAGLGRVYALMYARLGANVVVNDVSKENAEKVVAEVKALGAQAIAAPFSAEDGEAIVKAAMDAFGAVHVLVANAGILRDKSFQAMTPAEWDAVIAVHLKGTYKCAKAVWPVFQAQKYGRIVTTASGVGLYGNFGQANYSTAKSAIIGLTKTLAIEGARYNIKVNVIAPSAGTAMTKTIWPPEMVEMFKPDYVAPIVGFLTSDDCPVTGTIYEVMAGWAAQVRWERTGGHCFPNDKKLQPEDVLAQWKTITNFTDGRATHPTTAQEAQAQMFENFNNVAAAAAAESSSSGSAAEDSSQYIDPEDPETIRKAKQHKFEAVKFSYDDRDVMLYNLGVGAKASELPFVFEGSDDFQALPTFGVVPQFGTSSSLGLDFVPNFDPAKLLHGEQYLKIKAPIPTNATLINKVKLLEVLDKGKAATVTMIVETIDKATGKSIFENQSTVMLRGSGGFNGKKKGIDRGPASAINAPPKRQPDAIVEEKTTEEQAAIYRLSGDRNPLHIDPEFAAMGGFKKPILHGLCSMGIAGKHVLKTFGPYSDIKVRFAGTVVPGETLVTEMWKEGNKVIFTTKVKERNAPALAAAAVTLVDGHDGKAVRAKL